MKIVGMETHLLIASKGLVCSFESLLKLTYYIRYTQPERLGANVYSCSKCGNTFQVQSFSLFLRVLIYTIF